MVAPLRLLALMAPLLLCGAASPVQRFKLDGGASEITARVAYLGLGHKTARFPVMRGGLVMAPDRLEAIDLSVDLDTRALTAGGKTDTAYLRGKDFFDVARYPSARFSGHRMAMTGPNSARIDGEITVRQITRPAVLAVSFARPPARSTGRDPIDLTATTTINRRDFGMTAYSLVVGKKVTVTIRARLLPD